MKSEVEKLFLKGGPYFHTDAINRENFGYLNLYPFVKLFCFVLIENRLTKKKFDYKITGYYI